MYLLNNKCQWTEDAKGEEENAQSTFCHISKCKHCTIKRDPQTSWLSDISAPKNNESTSDKARWYSKLPLSAPTSATLHESPRKWPQECATPLQYLVVVIATTRVATWLRLSLTATGNIPGLNHYHINQLFLSSFWIALSIWSPS